MTISVTIGQRDHVVSWQIIWSLTMNYFRIFVTINHEWNQELPVLITEKLRNLTANLELVAMRFLIHNTQPQRLSDRPFLFAKIADDIQR